MARPGSGVRLAERCYVAALAVALLAASAAAQSVSLTAGSSGCLAQKPGAVKNLKVAVGDGSVTLSWDRSAEGRVVLRHRVEPAVPITPPCSCPLTETAHCCSTTHRRLLRRRAPPPTLPPTPPHAGACIAGYLVDVLAVGAVGAARSSPLQSPDVTITVAGVSWGGCVLRLVQCLPPAPGAWGCCSSTALLSLTPQVNPAWARRAC